jgi:hypothetical protein
MWTQKREIAKRIGKRNFFYSFFFYNSGQNCLKLAVRLRADDLCAAARANSEDYENVGRVWRREARMGRLARCGPRLHGQPCARASDDECARPQTYSVVWRARCVLLCFFFVDRYFSLRHGDCLGFGNRASYAVSLCLRYLDRSLQVWNP